MSVAQHTTFFIHLYNKVLLVSETGEDMTTTILYVDMFLLSRFSCTVFNVIIFIIQKQYVSDVVLGLYGL